MVMDGSIDGTASLPAEMIPMPMEMIIKPVKKRTPKARRMVAWDTPARDDCHSCGE